MSGSRHHFIPRFLQKVFASRISGDEFYCWSFSKTTSAFQSNIKNIGIENLFYSEASETDLDDKITDREMKIYSPLIDRLRLNLINTSDIVHICEMLAHFEVRSRHMRINSKNLMAEATNKIIEILSDKETVTNIVSKLVTVDSDLFQAALKERGVTESMLNELIKLNPNVLEQCRHNIVHTMCNAMTAHRATIPKLIAELAKNSHLKTLNSSIAPEKRVQRFSELYFSVKKYPPQNLPLGDSIVIFNVEGERPYKAFLDKKDKLLSVILPLSPSLYLEGSSRNTNTSHANLGLEIARCSIEYFISNKNDPTAQSHKKEIGINSHWLTSNEITEAIYTSFNEVIKQNF